MRFLFIFLISLISIFNSYSDTNGIWINAEDIRGGILGDDENSDDFGVAGNLNISKDLYLEKLSSCYGSNQVLGLASNGSIVCVSNDDADNNNTNEIQILSIDSSSLNDEITISSGNTITIIDNINDSDNDPTNELPTSGNGIITGGTTVAIDPTYTQRRVVGTCSGYNQSIQIINQDGSVVCGNLDDYVSKTNGGTFNGLVDFTGGITINGNTLDSLYVEEGEVNSISTAMLQDDVVTSSKILDGSVDSIDLKDGSVTSVKILDGSIQGIDVNKLEIQLRDNSETTCLSGYALDGINNNGGYICTPVDTDSFNELQNLTFSGGVLSLTDSLVEFNLSNYYVDEGQVNSISNVMLQDGVVTSSKILDGSIGSIDVDKLEIQLRDNSESPCPFGYTLNGIDEDGVYSCTVVDTNSTNELQTLSVDSSSLNDEITISLGNSITIVDDVDDADHDPSNELPTSGNGIITGGTTVAIDSSYTQRRVTGSCFGNNSIQQINQDGSVSCFINPDADPSNEFQVLSIDSSSLNDEISLSDGNSITIVDDVDDADSDPTNEFQSLSVDSSSLNDEISLSDGNSITIVDDVDDADHDPSNELPTSGNGIITGGTTVAIDPSYTQRRVTGSCFGNNSIQHINQDGSVSCFSDLDSDSSNEFQDLYFDSNSGILSLTDNDLSNPNLDDRYVPKTGGSFTGTISATKLVSEAASGNSHIDIKAQGNAQLNFYSGGSGTANANLILPGTNQNELNLNGADFKIQSGNSLCFGSNCRSNWDTVIQSVQCNTGEYLKGFDASGNKVCVTLPVSGADQGVITNQGLRIDGSKNFGLINTCADNQFLRWDSSTTKWECSSDNDEDPTNELQSLSLSGDILSISDRNSISLDQYATKQYVQDSQLTVRMLTETGTNEITGLLSGTTYAVFVSGTTGGDDMRGVTIKSCDGSETLFNTGNTGTTCAFGCPDPTTETAVVPVVAPSDGCIKGYVGGSFPRASNYMAAWTTKVGYQYSWKVTSTGSCSVSACGDSGSIPRTVSCFRDDGVDMGSTADVYEGCESSNKPATSISCSGYTCSLPDEYCFSGTCYLFHDQR